MNDRIKSQVEYVLYDIISHKSFSFCSDEYKNNIQKVMDKQLEKGINKYGNTLSNKDLTNEELINHAIEEGIDFAFYVTKLNENYNNAPYSSFVIMDMCKQTLISCLRLEQLKDDIKKEQNND